MSIKRFFIFFLCLISLSFSQDKNSFEYKPGRGLKIKPLKLTVGGYITISYKKTNNEELINLDDVAVLLYGHPIRRFRYFFEFELDEFYTIRNGNKHLNDKLEVERSYFSYAFSEEFKVKVGRFITPIGVWNPIHINVLKWTTSDPLTATEFFPQFTTGLEILGNLPHDFSYSLFFQVTKGISEHYNNFLTKRFFGFEIRKYLDVLSRIGFSGGKLELKKPKENLYFFGTSFLLKRYRWELSAEAMYAVEEEIYDDNWGYRLSYYIQGVYKIFSKNYAILRYGYFKDKSDKKNEKIWTFGWNYRPTFFTVLKLEYRVKDDGKNEFLASFSWMF